LNLKLCTLSLYTIFSQTISATLSFAKTPAETKNETVFGGEGLNPILASIQREDFKGQEPVWACSTHMY
jgi:hypothetical protein